MRKFISSENVYAPINMGDMGKYLKAV